MSKDDITAANSSMCAVCGASLEKRVTELELRASFERRIETLERVVKKLVERLE